MGSPGTGRGDAETLSACAIGMSPQQLRTARRSSVQYLYSVDLKQQFFYVEGDFRTFCAQTELSPELVPFVRTLVSQALADLPAIDALVSSAATNWKIDRMARVDLAILRVCTAELRGRPDLAIEVILADSAEIAKEVGAEGSSSFVNGVLDRVARDVRKSADS